MVRSTKRRLACSVSSVLAAAVACGGCVSSGLSPREARGDDYATFATLVSQPPASSVDFAASTQPARPLVLPSKIAVAQIGEVAPPQKLLDTLRQEGKIWSLVSPVNGVVERDDHRWRTPEFVQSQGEEMRQYARDLGADYLFVLGGTVDRSENDTGLALADATIIGAFVVPSKQIDVEGKAAGSLIDVQTGRVVLSVSADAHDRRLSPAASSNADEVALLESLRDNLIDQLGQRLIDQARSVANVK